MKRTALLIGLCFLIFSICILVLCFLWLPLHYEPEVKPSCIANGHMGYYQDWFKRNYIDKERKEFIDISEILNIDSDIYNQTDENGQTIRDKYKSTGHTENSGEITKATTCTDVGTITYKCTVCGETIRTEAIPALGHDMVYREAKAPTNTQNGNIEHYHCLRCGNNYDNNLKQLNQVVIPAHNTRGLEYNLIDERTCSVKIVDNAPREIKIDAIYECDNIEYTVTTIKADEGGNHDKVISIELPNTIEDIEENAFKGFSNLESITFGDNSQLDSIGEGAFEGCAKLKNIAIPAHINTIGARAFEGCAKLTNMIIPDSVDIIGFGAFEECTSLESVSIPFVGNGSDITYFGYIFGANAYSFNSSYVPVSLKTVVITGGESIENTAFYKCSGLTSITIGDGVTSIGEDAFYYCTNLTSITIPDSVTLIGDEAFSGCTNIKTATIPTLAISHIPKDSLQTVVITSGNSIDHSAFWLCDSLESITIPASVTSIGSMAFNNCTSLKSVNFENNSKLETIGRYAFNGCESLGSVDFGNNRKLYFIGDSAFDGCTSLTNIIMPAITSIGSSAFFCCISLTSITIPAITSIGSSAFSHCTSLTSITIPAITSIGSNAFMSCKSLESVTIGDGIASIGDEAFSGCTNIKTATIPTLAISHIPKDSLQTVVITSGNSIDRSAFLGCTKLTSITIPDSVTSIGSMAFYNCTSLENIDIPDGVTSIGDCAFYNCTSLISINIPQGVPSIGERAFTSCTSLESVTIGEGVTSIGSYAFSGCTSLAGVYITDLKSWCNIEFDNYAATPLYYAGKLYLNSEPVTAITADMLQGITEIKNYAFRNCKSLESIEMPDGITSIGNSAFDLCTSLENITIPASVTFICDLAFSGCINIKTATIPTLAISYIPKDSLQTVAITSGNSIGNLAFYNCTSLTSITISNSVTSIGWRAFEGCTSLIGVYITDLTAWCNIEFDTSSPFANPLVYARNLYLNKKPVTEITADMLRGVTEIKCYVFYGYKSLESITIPASVTSIGYMAFDGCTSLKEVIFNNTTGWRVSSGINVTVTDSTQNAKLLTSTYHVYTWRRGDN